MQRFLRNAIIVSAACLAGCDGASSNREPGQIVTPIAQAPQTLATPAPVPHLREGETIIQRVDPDSLSATPAAPTAPTGRLPTRKDFTDPPLPPELKDDGGLKPLPPRPRTTDR